MVQTSPNVAQQSLLSLAVSLNRQEVATIPHPLNYLEYDVDELTCPRQPFDYEIHAFEKHYATLGNGPGFRNRFAELLRAALQNRYYALIELLLEKAGTRSDWLQNQPLILHEAVLATSLLLYRTSQARLVARLLQHGAPIGTRDDQGRTPLHCAVEVGDYDLMALLLSNGVSLSAQVARPEDKHEAGHECSALAQLALRQYGKQRWNLSRRSQLMEDGYANVILHLLHAGSQSEYSNPDLASFVHRLCFRGKLLAVQQLCELGMDLPSLGLLTKGRNPPTSLLHAAVLGGRVEIVGFLLGQGLNPSVRPKSEREATLHNPLESLSPIESALKSAIYGSNEVYRCCEMLVECGADSADSKALLEYCVQREWTDRINSLLSRGVLVDELPLCANLDIIRALLAHGAKLDVPRFQSHALEGHARLYRFMQTHHPLTIDMRRFGNIVLKIMGSAHHQCDMSRIETLRYILPDVGHTIDTLFLFYREGITNVDVKNISYEVMRRLQEEPESDLQPRGMSDLLSEFVNRTEDRFIADGADKGELTNLLQLACKHELGSAVQWLLEQGAKVECIGLPDTALAYYLKRPQNTANSSHSIDRRTLELLFNYSSQDAIDNLKNSFLLKSEAFAKQMADERESLRSSWIHANTDQDHEAQPQWPSSVSEELRRDQSRFPDDSNEQLPLYSYANLGVAKNIRLFRLQPAPSHQYPLVGEVIVEDLDQCPPFEALSYDWGDATDTVRIQLDEARLQIPRSLAVALSRVRSLRTARLVWADAICINQHDYKEKSLQVRLMREIYSTAEQAIIWLGEATQCSRIVFAHIAEPSEPAEVYDGSEFRHSTRVERAPSDVNTKAALAELCRNPWFFRTQTLQEFVLCRKYTVVCGTDSISMQDFESLDDRRASTQVYHAVHGMDSYSYFRDLISMRTQSKAANFNSVLQISCSSHASDDRDRIYGLVGLLGNQLLTVDYSLEVKTVYREFASAAIRASNSLEILHLAGTNRRLLFLNSWVPDWSTSAPVGTLPRTRNAWQHNVRFPNRCLPGLSFVGESMVLQGKTFDQIKVLGGELAAHPDWKPTSGKFEHVLRGWEEMAAGLVADNRGPTILSSFARTLRGVDRYCLIPGEPLDYVLWDFVFGTGTLRAAIKQEFERLELIEAVTARKGWTVAAESRVRGFAANMEDTCYGRRFMITTNGSMGLAPPQAQAGDSIAWLPGGIYAFVLRDRADGSMEVVGDCLVEDLDAMALFDEASTVPLQQYTLT